MIPSCDSLRQIAKVQDVKKKKAGRNSCGGVGIRKGSRLDHVRRAERKNCLKGHSENERKEKKGPTGFRDVPNTFREEAGGKQVTHDLNDLHAEAQGGATENETA